jgi:hypothetical protein
VDETRALQESVRLLDYRQRFRPPQRHYVVPPARKIWKSISRNAALFVTLLYIAAVGGRLAVLISEWPSSTATPTGTRVEDAALLREGIEAERLGAQACLLLLPWIVLAPRNAAMLVLVAGLNVGTVYAIAVILFGRPRKWQTRESSPISEHRG